MENNLSRQDKVALAEDLAASRGWQFFTVQMRKLMEVKSGEIIRAYAKNEQLNAAFSEGFKMALETVLTFPEKTIIYNKGLIEKLKNEIEDIIGVGGTKDGS